MNCPICESELTHLTRPKSAGTQHFFCETCEVEFYVYPPDNKDALQRTGWYAHIPLKNFPRKVWYEFLNAERNYYGDEMPSRGRVFRDAEEKTAAEEYYREEGQKVKEWEKRVG